MIYRITLSSNPKSILVILLAVLLPTAGVLSFQILPSFISVVLVILGVYLSYQLFKFLKNIFLSSIEVSEYGMKFRITAKETASLSWESISFAGMCRQEKMKPSVFLYNETDDRLLTIPSEYTNFENLLIELKEWLPIEIVEIELSRSETIRDYLRDKLGLEGKEPDNDDEVEDDKLSGDDEQEIEETSEEDD
jgi:hypothetical protein